MPRYAKRTTKKRPAYRKKTSYRTKKRTYRRKTSSRLTKKIHAVADTKKQDTLACAIATPVTTSNPAGVIVKEFMDFPLDSQVKIYMWSPLARIGTDKKGPHLRNQSRVHYTGVNERMNIASGSKVPLRHRRIVLRGGVDFSSRMLASKVDGTLLFRNLDQVTPSSMDTYFLGQKDLDWSDPMKADIDKQIFTVMYDKTFVYNPPNDFGFDRYINFYHKINRKISYADQEDGVNTKWSTKITGKEASDILIVDMFKSTFDTRNTTYFPYGVESCTIGSKSKVYWRET